MRHLLRVPGRHLGQVSIHAPTRGATATFFPTVVSVGSFQSTHPHGVRLSEKMIMLFMARFQSTHPHGVRHWPGSPIFSCQSRFNPRTHTGCDSISTTLLLTSALFQSTHPHGVRRLRTVNTIHRSKFQSTHPHGVRPLMLSIDKQGIVSIHAPTRGVTFNPGLL